MAKFRVRISLQRTIGVHYEVQCFIAAFVHTNLQNIEKQNDENNDQFIHSL